MKINKDSESPIYKLGGIGNKFVFVILGSFTLGLAITTIPASYLYGFSIDTVLIILILSYLSYFCLSRVFAKEYTFAIYNQRLVINSKSFAWEEIKEIDFSEKEKLIKVKLIQEPTYKISRLFFPSIFFIAAKKVMNSDLHTRERRKPIILLAQGDMCINFNRKSEFRQALEIIVHYANLNKIPITDLDEE